jgi:aminopeptidase
MDPRTDNLANIVVNYAVDVQPGHWVLIWGNVTTLPLIHAIYKHVLKAGGHPEVRLTSDDLDEFRYKYSSDEQLQWVSPLAKPFMESVDSAIYLYGTQNTRSMTGADPQKQQMRSKANRHVQEIRRNRTAAGEMRWVITLFPCPAYAQEADMSLSEFEDFVYGATFADKDDPVGEWTRIHDEQESLVEWLAGKREMVVKGPNVDLTLSIDGRAFMNADGKFNMPDGEIFTGPVEESVNGWVKFTYPAIRQGREVEGVEFEFKDGKVVSAKAKKNEAYLLSQLDADEGARYLGEFAIGTNYGIQQFTKNILFDEKIGGTIHMAVGSSFPQTGGKNESAIHWDFICDMRNDSEIWVDGELLYKNGQFQL